MNIETESPVSSNTHFYDSIIVVIMEI